MAGTPSPVQVGDSSQGWGFRGFATFNMALVASGILAGNWKATTLQFTEGFSDGTVYSSLGPLYADSLTFTTLGLNAFTKPDDNYNIIIPQNGTTKSLNVLLPIVLSIYEKRTTAQFRLAASKVTDGDSGHDFTTFTDFKLILHYLAP